MNLCFAFFVLALISPTEQLCDTLQAFNMAISLPIQSAAFKPFELVPLRMSSPNDVVGGFQVTITTKTANGILMSAPGCPAVTVPSALKCISPSTATTTIRDVHNALRNVAIQIPSDVMSQLSPNATNNNLMFSWEYIPADITNEMYLSSNGHIYNWSCPSHFFGVPGLLYLDAKTHCLSQKLLFGMRGYLATVTTLDENQFLYNSGHRRSLDAYQWLCGFRSTSDIWTWECGPENGQNITYTNWETNFPTAKAPCSTFCSDYLTMGPNKVTDSTHWEDATTALLRCFHCEYSEQETTSYCGTVQYSISWLQPKIHTRTETPTMKRDVSNSITAESYSEEENHIFMTSRTKSLVNVSRQKNENKSTPANNTNVTNDPSKNNSNTVRIQTNDDGIVFIPIDKEKFSADRSQAMKNAKIVSTTTLFSSTAGAATLSGQLAMFARLQDCNKGSNAFLEISEHPTGLRVPVPGVTTTEDAELYLGCSIANPTIIIGVWMVVGVVTTFRPKHGMLLRTIAFRVQMFLMPSTILSATYVAVHIRGLVGGWGVALHAVNVVWIGYILYVLGFRFDGRYTRIPPPMNTWSFGSLLRCMVWREGHWECGGDPHVKRLNIFFSNAREGYTWYVACDFILVTVTSTVLGWTSLPCDVRAVATASIQYVNMVTLWLLWPYHTRLDYGLTAVIDASKAMLLPMSLFHPETVNGRICTWLWTLISIVVVAKLILSITRHVSHRLRSKEDRVAKDVNTEEVELMPKFALSNYYYEDGEPENGIVVHQPEYTEAKYVPPNLFLQDNDEDNKHRNVVETVNTTTHVNDNDLPRDHQSVSSDPFDFTMRKFYQHEQETKFTKPAKSYPFPSHGQRTRTLDDIL